MSGPTRELARWLKRTCKTHGWGAGSAAQDARGAAWPVSEPRIARACYEPATGRVLVEWTNACSVAFPARRLPGLDYASEDELAEVTVDGSGLGLVWPRFRMQLSVPALVGALFGSTAHMDRERAARAGSATSPKKAAAARRNGAQGGRPRQRALDSGKMARETLPITGE